VAGFSAAASAAASAAIGWHPAAAAINKQQRWRGETRPSTTARTQAAAAASHARRIAAHLCAGVAAWADYRQHLGAYISIGAAARKRQRRLAARTAAAGRAAKEWRGGNGAGSVSAKTARRLAALAASARSINGEQQTIGAGGGGGMLRDAPLNAHQRARRKVSAAAAIALRAPAAKVNALSMTPAARISERAIGAGAAWRSAGGDQHAPRRQ